MAILDDLSAFWELGEATGATRSDSSGNGNHLTNNNNAEQIEGKVGDATHFTAADTETCSIADNTSLSVSDQSFTIAAWVYLDDTTTNFKIIMSQWDHTGNQRSYLLWASTLPRFAFFVSSDGVDAPSIQTDSLTYSTNTWYFVVGWYDHDLQTINIQVDNDTPETPISHTTGVHNSTAAIVVGGAAELIGLGYMNGRIDQLGFWKRVLTADERAFLFNSGAGRSYAELGEIIESGYIGTLIIEY